MGRIEAIRTFAHEAAADTSAWLGNRFVVRLMARYPQKAGWGCVAGAALGALSAYALFTGTALLTASIASGVLGALGVALLLYARTQASLPSVQSAVFPKVDDAEPAPAILVDPPPAPVENPLSQLPNSDSPSPAGSGGGGSPMLTALEDPDNKHGAAVSLVNPGLEEAVAELARKRTRKPNGASSSSSSSSAPLEPVLVAVNSSAPMEPHKEPSPVSGGSSVEVANPAARSEEPSPKPGPASAEPAPTPLLEEPAQEPTVEIPLPFAPLRTLFWGAVSAAASGVSQAASSAAGWWSSSNGHQAKATQEEAPAQGAKRPTGMSKKAWQRKQKKLKR